MLDLTNLYEYSYIPLKVAYGDFLLLDKDECILLLEKLKVVVVLNILTIL